MTVDTDIPVTRTSAGGQSDMSVLGLVASPHWDPEESADPLAWQERALCAQTDPEVFFPEKGGPTSEARKVCMSCDVRGECLEYALANDERFGIWGGLSEVQRRKMRKSRVG